MDGPLRRWKGTRSTLTARFVLAEIAKLARSRQAALCQSVDDEAYLRAALPSIGVLAGGIAADAFEPAALAWAASVLPEAPADTVKAAAQEVRERAKGGRLHWTATELGRLLAVSLTEREAVGLKRMRPAGMSGVAFRAYRLDRAAKQQKAKRVANGALPREMSAERLKPWLALGISKSTFYRRKRQGAFPSGHEGAR
ncbi:UNVERIFIED_ORG: hypothetical protein J2W74_005240 [Methylorubrum zatmanii]